MTGSYASAAVCSASAIRTTAHIQPYYTDAQIKDHASIEGSVGIQRTDAKIRESEVDV
jgi:hypothetical protein